MDFYCLVYAGSRRYWTYDSFGSTWLFYLMMNKTDKNRYNFFLSSFLSLTVGLRVPDLNRKPRDNAQSVSTFP
jgi:hypothetical protein